MMESSIFQEIADWKLDAKFDDIDRYFYYTTEARLIEEDKKWFVVGRKGSGKSAISRYLYNKKNYNTFSQNLSFKNFPFNLLYSLSDESYTSPNQYISLWKFVIYSFICRSMAKNQNIDIAIREPLALLLGTDTGTEINSLLPSWTTNEFSAKLFDLGAKFSKSKPQSFNNDWQMRLRLFENIIKEYIDDSTYYIVFDELDEDYKNVFLENQHEQYSQLK